MGRKPNLNVQGQFRKLLNHPKYKVILRKSMYFGSYAFYRIKQSAVDTAIKLLLMGLLDNSSI